MYKIEKTKGSVIIEIILPREILLTICQKALKAGMSLEKFILQKLLDNS